ncbi:MAG: RHS repeat-associated core domain-containing protein [Opitutae bacterium]|nr:RHS repeat-associated core domain-containing protein [Opitutae bacterium]
MLLLLKLLSVALVLGNVKSMAYDARGNVTIATMGAGTSDAARQREDGAPMARPQGWSDRVPVGRDEQQDPANPTTGFTTRTTYNALSAPTQITDPDGRVQTFNYDPATNSLLAHTLSPLSSQPSTTSYTYNPDGTLATITDALGNVTSHTYNYAFSDAAYPGAVKQITVTVTDPAGSAGSDAGNASATVLRTTRTLYDAQENMLAQIATRTLSVGGTEDVVTKYLDDSENRLKATVMPDGKVSETRYTSFGQTDRTLLWRTLADYQSANTTLARVTSYGYDARGSQTSVAQPDGSYELKSFDAENRLEWSEDANRNRSWFSYDSEGRKTHAYVPDATPLVSADGPYTQTIYDLIGRVRFEMDEAGSLVEYTYDNNCGCAMRRKSMIRHLQSGNEITFFDYDKAGNQTLVTDPRGNTTSTDYDEQSRPTTVHYPATDEHPATTMVTGYDLLGRRVSITDQEGKVTRNRYDGLGRLVEVRQYLDQSLAAGDAGFSQPPSAIGVVSTRYTYDETGNQLSQADARGNTTNYQYDSVGRRTQRTLPDAAVETTQFDEWGNLWKRTDFAGKTTTFLYDVRNRLIEKQADPSHPSLIYPHAPDKITYGYDAVGNRTDALVEKGAAVLYAENTPFNERNWQQSKETSLGKLTYDRYANGLLKSIASSTADGVKLGYRYDGANRLAFTDDTAGGTTRTTAYGYNADGSLASVTTPNAIVHAYNYDTLNRLRTLNVAKGAVSLHSYDYKLRASGHRRQIIENGARTSTFDYDSLYRLTNETLAGDTHGNNGIVAYGLDKVGNRETRTSSIGAVPSATSSFNSRDWLNSDTYDANGNTTVSVGITTQPDVYDFEDRLIIRRRPDGSTVNLSYDADGILRQKTVFNASSTLVSATGYFTDKLNPTGYAQVIEERINAAAGTTVKVYAYGSDLISQSTLAPGSTLSVLRYFTYDGLGSVRELTSESGSITDAYDYDAFGIRIYSSGTTSNDYLYRGERFDSDTGQYYLRARFYNQNTDRFWNADSYEGDISIPLSLHRYLYGNVCPLSYADPTGNIGLNDLTITQAVEGILQRSAQIGIRKITRKAGCYAIEYGIEEAVGKAIYIAIDDFGVYVGNLRVPGSEVVSV